ncbi:hypothetical protein I7I48_08463 [Histoplasma ohiense]|nr:hypothetical protein I7I48_08463 [Histoplasma ohiense (nom. inval.)]
MRIDCWILAGNIPHRTRAGEVVPRKEEGHTIATAAWIFVIAPSSTKSSALFNNYEVVDIVFQQTDGRAHSYATHPCVSNRIPHIREQGYLARHSSANDHHSSLRIVPVAHLHLAIVFVRFHSYFTPIHTEGRMAE